MPPKKATRAVKSVATRSRKKQNEEPQIVDNDQIGNESQTSDLTTNAKSSTQKQTNPSAGQPNNDSVVNLTDSVQGKNLFLF